jgi:hypothetical protein
MRRLSGRPTKNFAVPERSGTALLKTTRDLLQEVQEIAD